MTDVEKTNADIRQRKWFLANVYHKTRENGPGVQGVCKVVKKHYFTMDLLFTNVNGVEQQFRAPRNYTKKPRKYSETELVFEAVSEHDYHFKLYTIMTEVNFSNDATGESNGVGQAP